MSKKTKLIAAGVLALLVLAGAANKYFSKSAAEKVVEAATGGRADVDPDTGNVTVQTDQGTWSSSDKLPADFPSDVPLYPDARVQASVAATQEQGGGLYVGLETTDSIDRVFSWYKAEAAAEGWKVTTNFQVSGGKMISGTKDTRDLVVTISEEGGKVAIGLVVTQKQ